jgi:hypothetical protein
MQKASMLEVDRESTQSDRSQLLEAGFAVLNPERWCSGNLVSLSNWNFDRVYQRHFRDGERMMNISTK